MFFDHKMLYFRSHYATIKENLYLEISKMRQIFQTIFCVLAVISVASVVLLGVLVGWLYALIGVGAALLFACLMLWCKNGNPFRKPPEEPHADYMNTDEENERLNGKK